MTESMMTVDDVAKFLGCSARTVYRLIATGAMPAPLRIGGLIRWQREVLESWIARGCPRRK
ncbi:MAG: helix-turn-helix domain-containing protein [Phycisphaerae bacterium]|nr:helix-turn-helix domain-containing protein [Phycisphaerae bacterium]